MYRAWITPGDLLERGTYRIIPFSFFTDKYFSVKGTLAPGSAEDTPVCRQKGIVETVMEPVTTVVGLASDIALQPLKDLAAAPGKAYDATLAPLQVAVEQGLAPSVTAGLKVAQLVPKAIAAVPAIAANVQNKISNAAAVAAPIATAAAVMAGGSNDNGNVISDGAVIFTLAVLVFGGGFLYLVRTRKNRTNGPPQENDAPPKPGTVRDTSPTPQRNL